MQKDKKTQDGRLLLFAILNISTFIALIAGVFLGKPLKVQPFLFAGVMVGAVMFIARYRHISLESRKPYDILLANISLIAIAILISLFPFSTKSALFAILTYILPFSLVGWVFGGIFSNLNMGYWKIPAAAVILVFSYFSIDALQQFVPQPEVEVKTRQGSYIPISTLEPLNDEGKTALSKSHAIKVVECWATWCKPCIQLMPSFQELRQQYIQNEEIEFIAVDMGGEREAKEKALRFLNKKNYDLPMLYDANSSLLDSVNSSYIPCTIILKNDTVQKVLVGNNGATKYKQEVSHIADSLLSTLTPKTLITQ